MLRISENSLHINHIMWQISDSCPKNCHAGNCYFKAWENDFQIKSYPEQIAKALCQEQISYDQLTLSINPGHNIRPIIDEFRFPAKKAVVLAAHSIQDLVDSLDTCCMSEVEELLFSAGITHLQISNPYDAPTLHDFIWIHNITEIKDKSATAGYDIVHTLRRKPILGDKDNTKNRDKYTKLLNNFHFDVLNGKFKFLVFDHCETISTHNNLINNIKCDAGTQFIHIWPDGVVTACPYDSRARGATSFIFRDKKGSLTQAVLEIIEISKKSHSFDICKLGKF